jgi:hypothetical protein
MYPSIVHDAVESDSSKPSATAIAAAIVLIAVATLLHSSFVAPAKILRTSLPFTSEQITYEAAAPVDAVMFGAHMGRSSFKAST